MKGSVQYEYVVEKMNIFDFMELIIDVNELAIEIKKEYSKNVK